MIAFITIIYENLLISLYELFAFDLWRNFIVNYPVIFPISICSVFVVGFYSSFTIDTESSFYYWIKGKLNIFIIVCLIGISGGCFMLYFSKIDSYYITFFILFTFLFFLFAGSKLAFVFRGNLWAQVYLFVILALLIGTYMISFSPSSDYRIGGKNNKQGLKKTFKGVAGREADAEEKKGFWKSAVGEEKPSEAKKDEYWKGKK